MVKEWFAEYWGPLLFTAILIGALCLLFDWLIREDNSLIVMPFKNKRSYKYHQTDFVYIPTGNWLTKTKMLKDFPTITFDQFKDFYYLKPDSWTLCDYRVFKNCSQELTFTFEYKEWKKYNKWHEQFKKAQEIAKNTKLKQKTLEEQNEITRKILEEVQKDIDKIRQKQQENINETSRLIKNINIYKE